MDGHFVPNITMGPLVVKAVRKVTDLPLDVHLMIENPDRFVPDFAKAGASLISVQVETCPHLHRTIHLIRECGCRPGAVLNPATPASALEWILDDLDLVTLMSVNPGFGGQKFIPSTLRKTRKLRSWIQAKNLSTLIEIDGGVNEKTISEISEAGADVFVAGSAIFESPDYCKTISDLKQMISRHPAGK
jgi:ribulose-phosphate 3-epimerase